jgi:RNA polymerase sigma-70 factor
MYKESEDGERISLPAAVVARWRVFESAQREPPGVDLGFRDFCNHLDELGYSLTLPKHAGAVLLCAACARGSTAALKILETNYFPALRRRVLRLARHAALADDVLQRVRERLLVGPRPRIAKYRGQGGLAAWLGVVASNALRDELRARRQERAQHAQLECRLRQEAELDSHSQQERPFASGYARQLELLLLQAVRGLSREDRQLLRLRYVDGSSVDQVARHCSHHRSTAARKIERSERHLGELLRQLISSHFGALEAPDFGLCLTTLQHQVPLSVTTLFAQSDDARPSERAPSASSH